MRMNGKKAELLLDIETMCCEIEKLLHELRWLAEQAADARVSDAVREQLQLSVQKKIAEIDRIGSILMNPPNELDS